MIAIVDDDTTVREALESLVGSLGHATTTFASAEDYLRSSRVGETDCLILDVQMPGMSGLDLQRQLAKEGHQFPIIFVSAFAEAQARERALNDGALAFLAKPINGDNLLACLGDAFAKRTPNG